MYKFLIIIIIIIAELKAAFDVTGMVVGSLRRDMDLGGTYTQGTS